MHSEMDMSAPVKAWLEGSGCSVKSEVRSVDMVGMTDQGIVIAIELKKTLNLEVVNQAVERQKYVDFVYIGIIHNSKTLRNARMKMSLQTLKRLGIGLVTVNFKATEPVVSKVLDPVAFDLLRSKSLHQKKRVKLIEEFKQRSLDLNKAGSKGTRLMTAYREKNLKAVLFLNDFEEMSPKELVEAGCEKKSIYSILNKNHYGWFDRVEKGRYRLSDQGRHAYKEYEHVIDFLRESRE